MMSWIQRWATPISIAVISVVGVTGLLMFFHVAPHVAEEIHEWGGIALLVAVGLHLVKNGRALKVYFRKRKPLVVSSVAALAVVGVFIGGSMLESGEGRGPGGPGGPPETQAVMQRVEAAPLSALAPLTGTTADALVSRLKDAGYADASADSTPQGLADAASQPVSGVLSTIFGAAT